ncbi:hypothetical protein TRFO_35750 [Tritrichomonas foetus]|uniref:Uncharacterized protein n=1 Tax=Tritrichomonas foetus TaxID=1144522 RepID=A0A1J4JFD0_9EUKA|nr:hypothetical protein TRFO_35750 [Tritrichomonas foetus]|eukprot:OHS97918.1 hypothetical protein TRFO_35750 [Tritrichomonas foetus]
MLGNPRNIPNMSAPIFNVNPTARPAKNHPIPYGPSAICNSRAKHLSAGCMGKRVSSSFRRRSVGKFVNNSNPLKSLNQANYNSLKKHERRLSYSEINNRKFCDYGHTSSDLLNIIKRCMNRSQIKNIYKKEKDSKPTTPEVDRKARDLESICALLSDSNVYASYSQEIKDLLLITIRNNLFRIMDDIPESFYYGDTIPEFYVDSLDQIKFTHQLLKMLIDNENDIQSLIKVCPTNKSVSHL